MGYRGTWVAVRGDRLEEALRVVGLRVEATLEEAQYDPGHWAVVMPGPWCVVFGDGSDAMFTVRRKHAKELSAGSEALFFTCNDTTMCAELECWRDGRLSWSIVHDGSEGRTSPTLTGEPPPIVHETIAALREEERAAGDDGVDYLYEAAPVVGLALTGFRHDQTLSNGDVLPIFALAPTRG